MQIIKKSIPNTNKYLNWNIRDRIMMLNGGQLYWLWKPEHPEEPTDLS